MQEFERLIVLDYRLTTAEILYRLPDHPRILQTYLWQEYDLLPKFPELHKFLEFWERHIDGRLHSVRVTSADSLRGNKMTSCVGIWQMH